MKALLAGGQETSQMLGLQLVLRTAICEGKNGQDIRNLCPEDLQASASLLSARKDLSLRIICQESLLFWFLLKSCSTLAC